ncbi:MAG: hypothetical protein Q6K80_01735 [Thermostichus sp. DG_1_6_bins_120]
MTFAGDQDSTWDANMPTGNREEEGNAEATGEGSRPGVDGLTSGEGRRTPPPLPDQDLPPRPTDSAENRSEDWLDSDQAQSSFRRSSREAREAAVGSASPRERSSAGRAGQALVPRRPVSGSRSYEGSRSRSRSRSTRSAYTGSYRSESGYGSSYNRSVASGYTSSYSYVGGGGSGTGVGGGAARGGLSPSNLTVVALVALLAFFGGFAIRNIFAESGGFDDERPIRAANVPEAFRDFCFAYNGTASFTVVELTSVSALTMASVPIYKMDTCTIPVSQTANALQALGIRGRASTLGPQLGGSNLTLIQIPLASGLARAIYNQFPILTNQGNEAQVLSQLETAINTALRSNVEGLALQSLEATNIPDVYVMVPGHSFNLQPQLNLR